MNIVAFILAIFALVLFLDQAAKTSIRSIAGGLAFLTTAWIIQVIWVTEHAVKITS